MIPKPFLGFFRMQNYEKLNSVNNLDTLFIFDKMNKFYFVAYAIKLDLSLLQITLLKPIFNNSISICF